MTGKGVAESGCRGREWPTERTSPPGKEASAVWRQERGVIIKKSGCFRTVLYGLFFICLFLPMVMGCHYREDSAVSAPEGRVVFDRIAVVPFQQMVPDESMSGTVRCPLCGITVTASAAEGNPERVLETLFLEQLDKNKPKFSLIAGERVAGIFRRVSSDSLKTPLRQVLRDVGNELGAEGVVAGYLYRFRERKGVAYTVEQPASVAFEIHLLRVSDGALIWRGTFDKTQSSLMEDLFQFSSFYRGKGRWVTAEELTEEGLEQILKTFPGMQ
jgi:hypothetical protein